MTSTNFSMVWVPFTTGDSTRASAQTPLLLTDDVLVVPRKVTQEEIHFIQLGVCLYLVVRLPY
jgi:hypothetical protein